MRIAIYAAGMPFNGETVCQGKSLGGSETAAYYMCKELASLGHTVICFTTSQEEGVWDGVIYQYVGQINERYPLGDRFHKIVDAPHDVVIIQRHPLAFHRPVNAKLKLWWLHDLGLKRSLSFVNQTLLNVDKILVVSEWHKNQVSKTYGVDKKHIIATTNGVDYSMFDGLQDQDRELKSLLYMARPERGLENLVGKDGIMERLPDYRLYVCGYDNITAPMKGYYDYLDDCCDRLPNVTNLGALGKKELYKKLSQVMAYVYPTTFEDTSCIAVLEANACGTPVIGSHHSAVPETIGDAGAVLLKLKDCGVSKDRFAKTVRKVCETRSYWLGLNKKALTKHQSWSMAAEQWDGLFHSELEQKSSNTYRLARHFERMSDIEVVRYTGSLSRHIDGFQDKYRFFIINDFADHYEKYYQYEKDRGVEYGPEDMDNNPRFETVCDQIKQLGEFKNVLDYGCAHGHYTINLAKRFPGVQFTGLDINQSNIETARKWAEEEQIENVSFVCGQHIDVKESYDLILVSEVLEHLGDPVIVMEELRKQLTFSGWFLLTTPYGPWEALGYKEHGNWRAHLHHFEREDLSDMFGEQNEYQVLALPYNNTLGHFIISFQPRDHWTCNDKPFGPFGRIDYKRKLKCQAPRQTLSVCIIAKDAENTLAKCLGSIKDIADEIIIGIDETTTDDTEQIAKKFGAKTMFIRSPLESGFDVARNQTIGRATMDWILWIDTDETLENAETILPYLVQNCYNGYGLAQHHYAVDPAGLTKTDYPIRLFRNHESVKFYGVVHEHPEQELNKGVGKSILIKGPAIMHLSYSTEAIRRKRFTRNWPLMKKDREKYPERILGRFLWVRDLAHSIKYALEQSGGVVTSKETIDAANEIIIEWRRLVADGHIHYAADLLQYYSEAVNVLGSGIQYGITLGASKENGGIRVPKEPLKALFANTKDIKNFTAKLTEEAVNKYDEAYY